jgi:hypothetical protein
MPLISTKVKVVAFLNPEGDSYLEGLTIDGQVFPVQWTREDWNRLKVGSQLELTCLFTARGLWRSPCQISAVITKLDLENLWAELDATFEGEEDALDPQLWDNSWADFYQLSQ